VSEPGIDVIDTHPVPAEQDDVAIAIATVLTAATASYGVKLAEIVSILSPWRIGTDAVAAALTLTETAHRAYARLKVHGLGRTGIGASIAQAAARAEVYSRAAYLAASASRIQRDVNSGAPFPDAVHAEKVNYVRHAKARANRLDTASRVGQAAERYGTTLGWWRNPESDSETECRVADGHNFDAVTGTMIGYPGAVHPRCACRAGPPHPDAGTVDDALRGYILQVPRRIASVA
jgi:hypothetical protein